MVRVAPINLAYNPRTLWFDPRDLDIKKGDPVVVLTARGVEFGVASRDVIEVSDEEIKALKTPLKPVKRLASEEDVAKAHELEQASREALPVFKEMVRASGVEMHPVSVEFLLDGDKAVFYFEAEDRVDFRDLVRKLAARFHVRIDMRQIGVRDEARIVGGLGHCGQELCCKRMGGDFNPVSIRMAKEQDLSLNPQKISGLCGRLMCCLRYEYDAYKDFKCRAPKVNATVSTPAGPAKVVELDVPREVVSLKVEGEKAVKVPLSAFDEPPAGARPNAVGDEAWDEATSEEAGYRGDPVTFLTSQFTGSDKLAEAGAVRHTPGGKGRKGASGADSSSKLTRRSARGRGAQGRKDSSEAQEARKPRRRSTKITAGEGSASAPQRPGAEKTQAASGGAAEGKPRRSRNRSHAVSDKRVDASGQHAPKPAKGAGAAKGAKGASSSSATSSAAKGVSGSRELAGKDAGKDTASRKPRRSSSGQRPGQKSSGLRQGARGAQGGQDDRGTRGAQGAQGAHGGQGSRGGAKGARDTQASGADAPSGAHRRRRRARKPQSDSSQGGTEQ